MGGKREGEASFHLNLLWKYEGRRQAEVSDVVLLWVRSISSEIGSGRGIGPELRGKGGGRRFRARRLFRRLALTGEEERDRDR